MVKRQIFLIFLAGLVLFGLAFAAAPWFAYRAMKANARDHDMAGLSEVVDFRAVRASLRGQVRAPPPVPQRAGTPAPAAEIWRDPLGAVRRALEPLAEPLAPLTPAPARLEPYLTADGLYALSRGYQPAAALPRPPAAPEPRGLAQDDRSPWPGLRYWGVNRMRFAVRAPEQPAAVTVLTFQRTGLFQWKLVHIRLPDPETA